MFLITKLQFNRNEKFNNHNTEKWDIRLQIQFFNPYPGFFGTITERIFWQKNQSTETYTNLLNAALWIFRVIVPRFGFFSRIQG